MSKTNTTLLKYIVDPLVFALSNVSLATKTVDGVLSLTARTQDSNNKDPGRVFDEVRRLMDKGDFVMSGKIPCIIDNDDKTDLEPVLSPAVEALLNLYANPSDNNKPAPVGTVFVLYDRPGSGKTSAALSLLQNFNTFPSTGEKIQGFLVATGQTQSLYVETMANLLGASEVEGWLNILVLAMDRRESEKPSILILDDFNSLGPDKKNIDFIRELYQVMTHPGNKKKKRMYVVVITQNEEVANELCATNGGERVRPLEGFYTGSDRNKPKWSLPSWSREQLIESVKFEYYKQLGDKPNEEFFFIEEGFTPLQASQEAQRMLERNAERPSSPKRRNTAAKV